jgi:hypothetical protein
MRSQACSLKRVMSFLLEMPRYLANGASKYSMAAARKPVNKMTQKVTK